MEPTEHLINKGIVRNETPLPSGPRTLIVLGVGRGGTSLCSKAINALGIFTGKDSRPPIYEDIPLSKALEDHDFESARSLINEYNNLHDLWAFKRPTTNDTIEELHRLTRNPIYLVVFRDILAIANRNALSMGVDTLKTMQSALSDYQKILAFLTKHSPPALFVSYEKALREKEAFVDQLVAFSGIAASCSAEMRSAAIESISPSPKDYLVNTSAVNYYGYLDLANEREFAGWAAFQKTDSPVELQLLINDQPICAFTPRSLREDIRSKGLHPTGECGFHQPYPDKATLKRGDRVSVRFAATGIELRNSPRTIQ
ncbi:hypothetical protein [Pelagicoccus sp. SDUM812003]|uniref:hypothetical protein n=1 Tax=Pelagicoccus sp. SDUM812003 TaxID=3041267 RepID=UPI00280C658E|nr:hypothetical protein [Pelagicoccus sp. SDUM812003]MDQ8202511.1 hypothetical protein [Pelagicoccus sp. SDUM812003]